MAHTHTRTRTHTNMLALGGGIGRGGWWGGGEILGCTTYHYMTTELGATTKDMAIVAEERSEDPSGRIVYGLTVPR